ncbi:hypothetical protein FJT64_022146 [Amphibalanus amphitrite]|uniref:CUB domain-containing protein n=1 Tax=Amphibalanus amphitrite TaxID=1232801 RepID=A0A6A4WW61_AMPAM|nr:hypothetical protein FJT64_022146 [Amphibalanus amphitrite]
MPSSLKRSRQLLLLCLLLAKLCRSNGRGYEEHYPPVARQEFLPVEEVQTGQCNKTVAIYEDVSTPSVTAETYNKPLTCWYEFRPNGAPSSDYVIDIRFKTFNVGRVHNSTTCRGGYVQIIDGNEETPVTNHLSPGFFCGEMQNSKNFISETNSVKLIFHVDNFTEGTYLSFFSRTELTRALHKRYGKQPELYPGGRRGDPIIIDTDRFPHSVTGSGTDLLVTFTSSPAGPLLNEGFQFSVGSVPGKRDTQVRLRFTSFRVDPITAPLAADDGDCAESLAVYDAAEPRSDRLLQLFCDTFSAPAKSDPILSTGRTLLVLFTSRTGSFEASSLFYRASFDFFREAWWGLPVKDTRCDETFPSWHAEEGAFGGPQNRLVFEGAAGVRCRYTFSADPRRYARLLINVTELSLRERCQAPADGDACLQVSTMADRLTVRVGY